MSNNKDLPTNPNKMKFNQHEWLSTHVNNFYKFAETKPTLEEALDTRIFAKYLINLDIDHGGGAGNLEFVSDRLKNDKKFVLFVVEKDGTALQYASNELKNNPEVVLTAIKSSDTSVVPAYETVIQYASDAIKNDKEIILEAIKRNESALKYASPQLKKEILGNQSIQETVVSKVTALRDKFKTLVNPQDSKNKM